MATVVGYDNSNVRAFEQLLALGMNADQKRRDREMEQAQYLNSIGKNQEAEQLLAQSQRSPLRNLFASEAEARKFANPYAGPEQEMMEYTGPKLNAQQEILAELQGLMGDDKASYNKNIQALTADMTNRQIQEQGIHNKTPGKFSGAQAAWDDTAELFGRNLQGIKANDAPAREYVGVQSQNEAIQKANSERFFEGDENDVINSLTDKAYSEIENARTYEDKLRAYGKYKNTYDTVRKSFQGRGSLPSFNELVPPPAKGGGTGQKKQLATIVRIDERGNRVPLTTVETSALGTDDPSGFAFKNYKQVMKRYGIKDASQIQLVPAGTENTDTEGRDVKTKGDKFEQDLMEQAVFEGSVKKNVGWLDTVRQMANDRTLSPQQARNNKYNLMLDEAGDTVKDRAHPVTGEPIKYSQYVQLINNTAVDNFLK